jgi:hypothetical protein
VKPRCFPMNESVLERVLEASITTKRGCFSPGCKESIDTKEGLVSPNRVVVLAV